MAKKKISKEKVVDAEIVSDGDFVPDTTPVTVLQAKKPMELDVSSDELRRRTITLCEKVRENYLDLGQCLCQARSNQNYASWGFATFKEYTEKELGLRYTKAKYLSDIWLHYGDDDRKIQKLKEVSYDKITSLTRVANDENFDTWVEKAKLLSADDLKKEVKSYQNSLVPADAQEALAKEGDAQDNGTVTRQNKSINYQFSYEDYMTVCSAITEIKKSNPNIYNDAACIALACAEYLGSNSGLEGKDFAIEMIGKYEKLFPSLRLVLLDKDTDEVLIGGDVLRDLLVQAARGRNVEVHSDGEEMHL